jgi:DNA helicase-2/ATP-dependent DNA helicase PcrA
MKNFLNLEKMWPEIHIFKLEINYRSLPHIVEAGNAIIKQNKAQYEKNIKAHREGDKHIRVFEFADQRDEAIQIIEMITKVKEDANKTWSDFTILYRTNAQSVPFEQVCITDSIPYKVVG